jgi:lipopolysaccharide export system permease protein
MGQVKNHPESGLQVSPLSLKSAPMSNRRISLYIAREIAVPMGLGLTVFTFILLMGRMLKLMELVINKGVPLTEIFKLFICLLPSFLVITLPLAVLLGVMLGFGRLSSESEIVALKAAGISLYGMARAVVVLALIASLITCLLTLFASPAGSRAFRQQIFQVASSRANVGIQARVFNDEFDNLVLYTNQIDERQGIFGGILIFDQRATQHPAVILAQQGRVISDQHALTLTLRLENGSIHRSSTKKNSYQIVKFTTYDLNLNIAQQLEKSGNPPLKPDEMGFHELFKKPPPGTPDKWQTKLAVEFHKRLILPLAPLIFALIGIPLGIQSHRSGRGGEFSLALAVFLSYYLSLSFMETLVIEAGFPAGISLWLPNLIFLAGGIVLFQQTANEKRYRVLDWLTAAPWRNLLRKKNL